MQQAVCSNGMHGSWPAPNATMRTWLVHTLEQSFKGDVKQVTEHFVSYATSFDAKGLHACRCVF